MGLFLCLDDKGIVMYEVHPYPALRAGAFMNVTEWVEENWQGLECDVIRAAGEEFYAKAMTSPWGTSPQFYTYGAIAAALEAYYVLIGCTDEPLPPPPPEPEDPCKGIRGVKTLKEGYGARIVFEPCPGKEAGEEDWPVRCGPGCSPLTVTKSFTPGRHRSTEA